MNGHDAFGISKSYVPGKGYRAAKNLLPKDRALVRAKAQGKTIRLKTASGATKDIKAQPNRMKNARRAKGRQIHQGIKTERGKLTKLMMSRTQSGPLGHAEGYSLPDGRGGGHVVVHDGADFKTTAAHEMAHIKPRRNPVHMANRLKNQNKLGKEEGRADFSAHGRQTTGQYPGSQMFQGGYNEVQGKMAAAQYRKKLRKQP